jgi:hypothetical protein
VDRENSHTENSLSAYAIYHVHYEKHNMHMWCLWEAAEINGWKKL